MNTNRRFSSLFVAAAFFLNQLNLSAAGIDDYANGDTLKEMKVDPKNTDIYIGNLNAVIGAQNTAIDNTNVMNDPAYTKYNGEKILSVEGGNIGNLETGATLIFDSGADGKNTTPDDRRDDRLVSIILPDSDANPADQFADVVRHVPTGITSYTFNNTHKTPSQTFSDGTKVQVDATLADRKYALVAGVNSPFTTLTLKDGSAIRMASGASIGCGNADCSSVLQGISSGETKFDADVIQASKGQISWKKGTDTDTDADYVLTVIGGSVRIGDGASFTTQNGIFLSSNQGTITIEVASTAEHPMVLGDGTKLAGSGNITIKNGQWDLSGFQGTVKLGNEASTTSFGGVQIADGGTLKSMILTVSAGAEFTLTQATIGADVVKGILGSDLSGTKGALSFSLSKVSSDFTFTLQGATPTDANKTQIKVLAANDSTQFSIKDGKFNSADRGKVALVLPGTYTPESGDQGEIALNDKNDIKDSGIVLANGVRFVYANGNAPSSIVVNSNGHYEMSANTSGSFYVITTGRTDFAVFNVKDNAGNLKYTVSPKSGTGGTFAVNKDGDVNGTLDVALKGIDAPYKTGELQVMFTAGSQSLGMDTYTIATTQEKATLTVKNRAVDFANTSGKFGIKVTGGTVEAPLRFALKGGVYVEAFNSGTGPTFTVNSGDLYLNDGVIGQSGDIRVLFGEGYLPFSYGQLDVEALKITLSQEGVTNNFVLTKLGITRNEKLKDNLDKVTEKQVVDVFNDILKPQEKDFYKSVDVTKLILSLEANQLLKKAQAPGGSLNSQEILFLNKALLQAVYPKETVNSLDEKTLASHSFTTASGIEVTQNKNSFVLLSGNELKLDSGKVQINNANFDGDVTMKIPATLDNASPQRDFAFAGGLFHIANTADATFKLKNGAFDSSTNGTLQFTLNASGSVQLDKNITMTEHSTTAGALFDVVNGNIDFHAYPIGNNIGDTTLTLGAGARQIVITQRDNSVLSVGPGERTVLFTEGKIADASISVPGSTSRTINISEGGSITFTNSQTGTGPESWAHIGDLTINEWDFAGLGHPAVGVTVDVKNIGAVQTFKLRSNQAPLKNDPDITITVAADQSASFKVNEDGTFGGWLSGALSIQIVDGKSLVLGTPTDNVTLLANAGLTNLSYTSTGLTNLSYTSNGIDLTNFTGNLSLNNAPANKFTFANGIKVETKAGAATVTPITITAGTPDFISGSNVTVKDKFIVTLANGIGLASDGGDVTVNTAGNYVISGTAGKLAVTKPASIPGDTTFVRDGAFSLAAKAGTASGFTVDLSNNNISNLTGSVTLMANAALNITGAQGNVSVITHGNNITLDNITFHPSGSEDNTKNFTVANGKVDLTAFTGDMTLSGVSATTFVLKGATGEPNVEFTPGAKFSVVGGVLTGYVTQDNFVLPANSSLIMTRDSAKLTFASGVNGGTVLRAGSVYELYGDVKVTVDNAASTGSEVFKVGNIVDSTYINLELTVEKDKSASFAVSKDNNGKVGILGDKITGDVTVNMSGANAQINGIRIIGSSDDQFKLSDGKIDLRAYNTVAGLTVNITGEPATFILNGGIELTAKTGASFTVNKTGALNVSSLTGSFSVTLSGSSVLDVSSLADHNINKLIANNGSATIDIDTTKTTDIVDLKNLKGTLDVEINNTGSPTIHLAQGVDVQNQTSDTHVAAIRVVNGNLDTYKSGKLQITTTANTTPDMTVKFDGASGFGADSQVVYRKGAVKGSFTMDDGANKQIDFTNGVGRFEVSLKGAGDVPTVKVTGADINPIVTNGNWSANMVINDKKIESFGKGDFSVTIPIGGSVTGLPELADNTKILSVTAPTTFKISNGMFNGFVSGSLNVQLGANWMYQDPVTHANPESRYKITFAIGATLHFSGTTGLPTVTSGIAMLETLKDGVQLKDAGGADLGVLPKGAKLVFKDNILQSDEYYYTLTK